MYFFSTFSAVQKVSMFSQTLTVDVWKVDLALLGLGRTVVYAFDLCVTVPLGMVMDKIVTQVGFKPLFAVGCILQPILVFAMINPPAQWLPQYRADHLADHLPGRSLTIMGQENCTEVRLHI